jgi:Holliday junction resolvase
MVGLMPNKNYIRGRAFEYEVRKELELRGIITYRTAGSHGQFDIIGFALNRIILIQCKTKVTSNEALRGIILKEPELTNFDHNYSVDSARWTKYIYRKNNGHR